MSLGAFHLVLALIGAATVVIFIEWLYRRLEPQDKAQDESHRKLMEEIRRHRND